jgi:hypothetical protein
VENDALKEFTIADSETLQAVNGGGLAWPEWETSSTAAATITPLFNRGDWNPGWICRIPRSTSEAREINDHDRASRCVLRVEASRRIEDIPDDAAGVVRESKLW